MRKKSRITFCYIIIFAIILICIAIGRITAKSYIDNVELSDYLKNTDLKVAYCGMGYDEVTNMGFIDNDKVENINDLIQEDTIVIKAKLSQTFQRKIYYECILSELVVEEVYNGKIEKGSIISCFEPVDCGFQNQMLCTDGYSMMQEGQEYILFLKTIRDTFYSADKNVYVPNSTLYSKYPINHVTPHLFTFEELEEIEKMYTYSEVKEEEVYLYEEEDYNKYVQMKEFVLEKYN